MQGGTTTNLKQPIVSFDSNKGGQVWYIFLLLSLVLLALALRLFPAIKFAVFGSDFGEYYFLTSKLTTSGALNFYESYPGWGKVYPQFPAIFIATGAFAILTDSSVINTLSILIPSLTVLDIIIIFLITHRVSGGNIKAGFGAGSVLAVVSGYVFVVAHPMPGAIGTTLLLLNLLLWLKTYTERKFYLLLIPTTFCLVITHHLSTYFLILAVLGYILLRELLRPAPLHILKIDLTYLGLSILSSCIYWFVIASEFRTNVILKAIRFLTPQEIILLVIVGGYITIVGLIFVRRKYYGKLYAKIPPERKFSSQIRNQLVIIFFSYIVILSCIYLGSLGTEIKIATDALVVFTPTVILVSFAAYGSRILRRRLDDIGFVAHSWLIVFTLSLLFAIITKSEILLAYRHIQYLMLPASILIGTGLWQFLSKLHILLQRRFIFIYGLIVIIIIANTVTSYPDRRILGGFEEGTYAYEFEGIYWARYTGYQPECAYVTDHRMSSLLFGFANVNCSWEYYAGEILLSSKLDNNNNTATAVIHNCKLPSGYKRLTYVFIDDSICEGVALKQWEQALPMPAIAKSKFNFYPFIKVFSTSKVQVYYIVSFI